MAIRVYWGGELFDGRHLIGNAMLAEAVAAVSGGRFQPVLPQECAPEKTTLELRDEDYSMLLSCDAMLAILDGSDPDSGTTAELLFAKMLDIPVLLLRTDFRSSGDGGDPWNLMCSGFPRSRKLVVNGMALWHEVKRRASGASEREYPAELARRIAAELEAVCAMTPVFRFEELPGVFRNVLRAAGGSLNVRWPEEKLRCLLEEKHAKGVC